MSSSAHPRRHAGTPVLLRMLLSIAFLFAVTATVLVVLWSDQLRVLRIAVILALWAALIAAFAVARSRREARAVTAREAEITRTYELELHREVTARREFESGLTAKVNAELADRHSSDLADIRAQLDRLTSSLSGLIEGDFLLERLTLSAESTRVRSLAGHGSTLIEPAHPAVGQLAVNEAPAVAEISSTPVVEAISPVEELPQVFSENVDAPAEEAESVQVATQFQQQAMDAPTTTWLQQDPIAGDSATNSVAGDDSSTGKAPQIRENSSGPETSPRIAAVVEPIAAHPTDADEVELVNEFGPFDESAAGVPVATFAEVEPDDDKPADEDPDYGSRIPVHQLLQAFGSDDQPRRHRRRSAN